MPRQTDSKKECMPPFAGSFPKCQLLLLFGRNLFIAVSRGLCYQEVVIGSQSQFLNLGTVRNDEGVFIDRLCACLNNNFNGYIQKICFMLKEIKEFFDCVLRVIGYKEIGKDDQSRL